MSGTLDDFIEKCSRSTYPNLAAEFYCNPWSLCTWAEDANVTEELFQAVLDGTEELELIEAGMLLDRYNSSNGYKRTFAYIASSVLSVYKADNERQFRKVRYVFAQYERAKKSRFNGFAERMFQGRIELPLQTVIERGGMSRAALNRMLDYIGFEQRERMARPKRGLTALAVVAKPA